MAISSFLTKLILKEDLFFNDKRSDIDSSVAFLLMPLINTV